MSTGGTIAGAFVAAIGGLALDGSPAVRRRKRLIYADGDPADGLVLVAQGDGQRLEPLGDFGTGLVYLVTYPVSVAATRRSAGKLGDDETVRGWMEAVRDRFRKPDDLSGINDIEPDVVSAFDTTGVQRQSLAWSELNFRVSVIE